MFRNSEDFLLLSSIFSGVESDSYIPYCEISHEISQVLNTPLCDGNGSTGTQTSDCYYSGFGSSSLTSTENPHININEHAVPNLKNQITKLSPGHVGNSSGISKSPCSKYVNSQSKIGHFLDSRSTICEESDDSDSEIFRVKRRSSSKVEQKIVCDSLSVNTEQQGFKRLKKLQKEAYSRQLTPYEWSSTGDNVISNHPESKEASVGLSKDKLLKARGISISIKFKKKGNEVLSKHGESHRCQNELGNHDGTSAD